MQWKRCAAMVALSLLAAPAVAQVSVEDVTVDPEDVSIDLESAVPKVEKPAPVGADEDEDEEEEREEGAPRQATVPYLFGVDPAALDDGRVTEDELFPVDTPVDPPGNDSGQLPLSDAEVGTINPNQGAPINPDAEPSINPDAERSINPDAEPSINPDAERGINPSAGRLIDPQELQKVDDAELERFADERRANVVALQDRIDRSFRDLRQRRIAAFEDGTEFTPDAYDGLNEELTQLENELTNLETAYRGLGQDEEVATLNEVRRRLDVARQQVPAMRNAQNPRAFGGAADNFGDQVGALRSPTASDLGTSRATNAPRSTTNRPSPSRPGPSMRTPLPTPAPAAPTAPAPTAP